MTITKHIAVFAFPYGSHPTSILHLVRMLANSTPSVRFSFLTTAKSKLSLFSGQDSENIRAYEISDGLPEGFDYTGEVEKLAEYFIKAAPESFKNGVEAAEADVGEKVTGLLTDAFFSFSGEMAAAMGVPWVAFWVPGPVSVSAHLYTDLIRSIYKKNGAGAGENGEINLNFIPGMSEICMSDLPEGIVSGDLESTFARMIYKMGLVLPKARAVVINSFEELDPVIINDLKTKLQDVLTIGPSLLSSPPPSKPDESGCLTWLDTQKDKSVVYIGFGTICTPPPDELSALATALEDSGTPFLWSLRDNNKSLLPEGFLERTSSTGMVVAWVPQLQVLAHASVGIYVTHCGWNSVLEAISYGVPMIGRPFFSDNMMNSALVQNVWKIGVRVEGGVFTKTGTMKALQIVSSKAKGKEMRDNVSVLKEKAIKAVDLGGSSTKNLKKLIDIILS